MNKLNSKNIALGTLFLSFIMGISFCMIFLTNTVSADVADTVWQADKLNDINIITQSTIPESVGKFDSAYDQNVTLEFSSDSATNDGSGSIKGTSEEKINYNYMRFAYDLNKNEAEWLEIGKQYKLKIKLNAPAGYKLKVSYYLTYPGTGGSYDNHEIYVIDANKEIEGWEEFESQRISLQYADISDTSKGCVINVGNESFNGLGTSLANLKVFFYVYSADNTQISSETLIALDDFYVYDIQGSKAFINDEYYISDADDVIIVSNKDEVVTQTEYQIASGNVSLEYDSKQNAPDSKGGSLKYSGNGTTYKHMQGYVEKLEPGILYTWTVSVMVHDGQYRYLNATMLFQFSGGSANPYKSVENRDVALAQKNVNSGKGVWKTFYSNFRYEIDETGVYTFYDEKGDILFDTKTNYGGGATFEEGVQYTLNNIRIDLGTGSNETTYFHIDNVGIYQNVYAINNNVESVGYNIMPENNKMFVTPGEDFKFSIEVLEGYEKENFKVTANGQELTADEYGIYTLMSITSDTEIIVEGLKILSYEVKFFEENGATQIGETQIVEYGKSATVESAPDKTGYEFSHWVNMDNGEVVSDFTNIISNISVKAVYIPNTYTITYHLDNGTNAEENPSTYTYGTVIKLKEATKSGYTFEGWYITETFDEGTNITEISASQEGNLTLYAKFTKISVNYTVQIINNVDGMSATIIIIPEGAILNVSSFVSEMFTFKGLYKDAEFSEQFSIGTPITENTTLYAKWEAMSTAPEDITDSNKNSETENGKGCSGSVSGISIIAALACVSFAIRIIKKKEY